MTTTTYTDVGFLIQQQILAALPLVAAARDVAEQPALSVAAVGLAVPPADACRGMVWARVASQYPSAGTDQPYTATHNDTDPPAWTTAVEAGFLFCHENIHEDGGWISPGKEADYAQRDGNWRAVLLDTLAYSWLETAAADLAAVVESFRVLPFQPIGPDGGFSGGISVLNVVTLGLWVCTDTP